MTQFDEYQHDGEIRKFAVEEMNSSFNVVRRYWYENKESAEAFYAGIVKFKKPGFVRMIQVIHP